MYFHPTINSYMFLLMQDTGTVYNDIPCIARKCVAKVGDSLRQLVEVFTLSKKKVYLNDKEGVGWLKLTSTPSIPVEEIDAEQVQNVCYLESK